MKEQTPAEILKEYGYYFDHELAAKMLTEHDGRDPSECNTEAVEWASMGVIQGYRIGRKGDDLTETIPFLKKYAAKQQSA